MPTAICANCRHSERDHVVGGCANTVTDAYGPIRCWCQDFAASGEVEATAPETVKEGEPLAEEAEAAEPEPDEEKPEPPAPRRATRVRTPKSKE